MKSVRSEVRPSHEAIRATIAAIPVGRVANYGEIARRAGLPGRARLVGTVLREAPPGLALPWHRVLRADGRIAFAPGSRAFREQVRRLAGEGVLVRGGRVDLSVHGWERDIDHLLWGPPAPGKQTSTRTKTGARHRTNAVRVMNATVRED